MTPHLARVVAEAAAELRMRIQDPGDHPTPRSCQREVISCTGQATGEPAASLRPRANDTPPGGAESWTTRPGKSATRTWRLARLEATGGTRPGPPAGSHQDRPTPRRPAAL